MAPPVTRTPPTPAPSTPTHHRARRVEPHVPRSRSRSRSRGGRPAPVAVVRRGSLRGSPQVRLRAGFVMIAMVLSLFGARLVQLQGLDPGSYAERAAAEGTV